MISETPVLQRKVSDGEERYTNLIKNEFIRHAKEINRLGKKVEGASGEDSGEVLWENIGDKPEEFPPEEHTHPEYLTEVRWEDIQNKPSSNTVSPHTHPSSAIQSMNGYYKQSNASAITTEDTLNTAIGKLEKGLDKRAAISSPTFTGTPKAPTASLGTNTTQIATTQFVQATFASLQDSETVTFQQYQSTYEFPNVGESNVIYADRTNNKVYRWDSVTSTYYCIGSDYNDIDTIDGGGA